MRLNLGTEGFPLVLHLGNGVCDGESLIFHTSIVDVIEGLVLDFAEENCLLKDPIHWLLCIFQIKDNLPELRDEGWETTTSVPVELKVSHPIKSQNCSPFQVISALIVIHEGSVDAFAIFGVLILANEAQWVGSKNSGRPNAIDKLILGVIDFPVCSVYW